MVVRNVFDLIATEGAVNKVTAAIEALHQWQLDRAKIEQTPFARDSVDRMRVIIDGTSVLGATSIYWGNQSVTPTYYGTGSPAAMDAREQQQLASMSAFEQSRGRWTIT